MIQDFNVTIESLWYGLEPRVWQQLLAILVLMVILIPSAIGDYQQQRIPNWLSMGGWLLAPLIAWLCTGAEGIQNSLLGLTVMVGLLFPLWAIHWFGAADVKLMGSVGAFVGVSDSLYVLLGVLITGMVMALIILLYRKRQLLLPSEKTPNVIEGSMHSAIKGSAGKETMLIPYGIPIAFGTMLTLLLLQIY